jgi:AAA domain
MVEAENPRLMQGFLNIVPADEQPFALQRLSIVDEHKIPHRQWIYGTHLIRGYVTLLIAPGGAGKSSLILAIILSVAIGRPLLGVKVHQQCHTAVLNLEDPADEIDRRITALSLRYGISNADVDGRVFVSPAGRTVTIAAQSSDGFSVVHPDERIIIERVRDEHIGVLAVDPFAESHTLEENSNPAMVQASAAWRRVARLGNCSVLLAHHVRKGLIDSIEAARGAKALTDSARVGLLLSTMTEADAEQLGVPVETRLQYARLDDAKANLAPRSARASWFHLDTVTLDNAAPPYPTGDQVVVIRDWKPTSVWDSVSDLDVNRALDRIASGLPGGMLYTDNRRAGGERWAGAVLVEMFDLTEARLPRSSRRGSTAAFSEKRHTATSPRERTGPALLLTTPSGQEAGMGDFPTAKASATPPH